ncbi:MAG: 3-hydroxyacyl-CoA dehydrogenase/enoyl-CoA hydratase family protein [Thaumarchaeota archaeon]|nr:3-hydroxyacyl-CoA dehydrogenase/enoyl-CoA hydratase family protein [Candidatus Calditenuaceae archaeon]MDW8187122.1 3-hydroxyacyl-CoA dehydrogenase NAD-binding domain-containing protein [Nitrososphaerota archaeon]
MGGSINVVTVIGAGAMGHGIAQVAAMAGYRVNVVDVSEDVLEKALERIRWSLGKLMEKGRIKQEDVASTLSRLKLTTSIEEACKEADLVIEAVFEDVEVKRNALRKADAAAKDAKVIGTNTSSIPINELASFVSRPERFLGLHFFNPPQMMQLVEIIRGEKTSDEALKAAQDFVRTLGKTQVLVKRDVPGFIVNRILSRIFEVACYLVQKQKYSILQLDSATKYRAGFPMGVFELADFVGLDVAYNVTKVISQRDKRFRDVQLLREHVERGEYGVKSGKGFYDYSKGGRPEIPADLGRDVDLTYVLVPALNEAARLMEEGYASSDDVDIAMKLGTNLPKGIFGYAAELTVDKVRQVLSELEPDLGEGYRPVPYLLKLLSKGPVTDKEYQEIAVKREPPIGWIVLNRPHRLNTITPRMTEELEDAVEKLSADREIRVLVITGEGGRAFSAGADITAFSEILGMENKVQAAYRFSWRFTEVLLKLERCPKPVIAAIDGFALGGGMEIALACDFRLASDRSELGQPEIRLGLIPGAGGTQRLTRLLGPSKAKLVIYFGDRIKAKDAEALGMVDKVLPSERFIESVREFASRLAEMPPIGLEHAKAAINAALDVPIEKGLLIESALFGQLFATKDLAEGVSAFFSKRKPEFKGE